jgi:hypothetical protein
MIQTRNTEKMLKKELSEKVTREDELIQTAFMRTELATAHLASEVNRYDYIYIYTYIYIHIYMYFLHLYKHICIHIYTYICIYIRL